MRVSTEYPELTRRYFEARGVEADIRLSYGASEAKIPDIADCIVDITETGRALRAAGLRIIDTILVSHTELIANPTSAADPAKRHAMGQLLTLLLGALEARGKVLVKLNVAEADCERGPGAAAVDEVADGVVAGRGGFAVETVVEKRTINTLIPDLKDAGATDILELPALEDRALTCSARWTRCHRLRRGRRARHGHGRRRHDLPVPVHADRRRHPHHRRRDGR